MNSPWSTKDWSVNQYNFDDEIQLDWNLPSKVRLHDNTLRDGEQQAGLVFRKDEKIQAAKLLDELKVPEIELGMPKVSTEDFEAMRELSKMGLRSRLMCLVRSIKSDIDAAVDCGVGGVVLEIPSSYIIHKSLGWDSEEAVETAVNAVSYAKSRGLYVSLFPWDSTRANFDYWLKVAKSGVEAGADVVTFIDTLGVTNPNAMFHLIKKVKSEVKAPIEVHTHNDFGLATANAIAAVTAGAEIVDTAFNGLGERCGNASTEEVAVALKLLYGVETGIDFRRIYSVSQYFQKISNLAVPPTKPVVGSNVNTIEAGIAVDIMAKGKEAGVGDFAILPYDSKFVGNTGLRVVLGKKSGRSAIDWKLKELGIAASEEEVNMLLNKVKEEAIRLKRSITDEEFEKLVWTIVGGRNH